MPATLRIGSLEILLALAGFYAIASRIGVSSARAVHHVRLDVQVGRAGAVTQNTRPLTLTLGEDLPPALIGRSPEAAVGIFDPEVSRRHARLECTRGIVYLTDLGSSNGTFLNGKRLTDGGIEVRPGDDIDVGSTRLKIVATRPQAWT